MTASQVPKKQFALLSGSLATLVFRLVGLGFIDVFAIWFINGLINNEDYILAAFVAVITVALNFIFLIDGLYPFRWFSPGLTLLILMLIYPTMFTVYVAFTNYKDGNLFRPDQTKRQMLAQLYLPPDTTTYTWTAFRSTANADDYALWLLPEGDQGSEALFTKPGETLKASEVDLGGSALDDKGIPTALPGYERLSKGDALVLQDKVLAKIEFGPKDAIIKFDPKKLARAGVLQPKYTENADGTMLDNESGVLYKVKQGTYYPIDGPHKNADGKVTDADGKVLPGLPGGYYVVTGFDNIKRLVTNDKIRGPFLRVFIWTFAHAFFAVFLTFWFGLFLALVMNARFFPGRAVLRTALLVPYAMPAFISVLVWKGLLNEQLGIVNKAIETIFGVDQGPRWTSSPTWVKVGILLIQLWLGFPYMLLITTGALQSIPGDIYEAARVDGANAMQQFRFLTLPLLLVAVGPLLIASFAFNFNNFTIVELFNKGGPPISPDTAAGHSDILITYTYRLAFGSGRGADYGFASTISIVIFLIVATITFFNFRFTRTWEEISENV